MWKGSVCGIRFCDLSIGVVTNELGSLEIKTIIKCIFFSLTENMHFIIVFNSTTNVMSSTKNH